MTTPATSIVAIGAVAVVAALVGGGLKGFGVELPVVSSLRRQVSLFLVGAGLIILGLIIGNEPQSTENEAIQTTEQNDPIQPKAVAESTVPAFSGWVYTQAVHDNSPFVKFLMANDGNVVRLNMMLDESFPQGPDYEHYWKTCGRELETAGSGDLPYNREFDLPVLPPDSNYNHERPLNDNEVFSVCHEYTLTIESEREDVSTSAGGTGTLAYRIRGLFRVRVNIQGSYTSIGLEEIAPKVAG